jgi:hypothetical protein
VVLPLHFKENISNLSRVFLGRSKPSPISVSEREGLRLGLNLMFIYFLRGRVHQVQEKGSQEESDIEVNMT